MKGFVNKMRNEPLYSAGYYVKEFLVKNWRESDKNANAFIYWFHDALSKPGYPLFGYMSSNNYTIDESERHNEMAKKRRKDFGVTFINYKPVKADRNKIKAVAEDYPTYASLLDTLETDDLKLTVSYDDHTNAFGAYLTPRDETDPNKGFCVSSKHSNPIVAMTCVLYYHIEVSQGEWNKTTVEEDLDW